ncbi:MAG: glycosidase [Bacteroidetes bacterium]|nr:glycosidase [Bacteroidota bacterium]
MVFRRNAAPAVERLNNGAPIITKIETHAWENRVTFNPACALVQGAEGISGILKTLPVEERVREVLRKHQALVFLLYRAQGSPTPSYDHTRSSIGLAVLTPELELLARLDRPVILPDTSYDNLGVEDARIMRVGGSHAMTYTAYATGPDRNIVRIALAWTTNFVTWEKDGLIDAEFNRIDNKNGMLFEPIPGHPMRMLHRPMEGENGMMIHWAEAPSLAGPWRDRGVLMRPLPDPEFKDVWIGGGAPPLALPDGRYLALYHIGKRRVDGTREYDLGIAVIDPDAADPVVRRHEPLMRPETAAETRGDASLGVNNVVFICGAYFWGEHLYFPYAGADTCVLGGRIRKAALELFCAA